MYIFKPDITFMLEFLKIIIVILFVTSLAKLVIQLLVCLYLTYL